VLLLPAVAASLVGFGLLGLGIGPVVPMVFSAAGTTRTVSRPSVLGPVVSAVYVGVVVGPIVIGGLAGVVGRAVALIFPMAFVALILVGAPMLAAAAGSEEHREPHLTG
jgi:MFS family permease